MEQETYTHPPDDHPGRGRTMYRQAAAPPDVPSNHINPLDVIDAVGLPIPENTEIDMIPTVPPPIAWERSRSREGPGQAQPTQPAEPASPAGTIDYAPADEQRTPSVASTVDYREPEEVPLPVHVPPADDDSDDEDNDDRAAAVQTTPGMAGSSTKRASSTEDSPNKKSKKDDDNDDRFMSITELYLIHRQQLRIEHPHLSKDPNYWQQALQRRRALMNECLNETRSCKDRWRWHQQKGWLTRIHNTARQGTFSPIEWPLFLRRRTCRIFPGEPRSSWTPTPVHTIALRITSGHLPNEYKETRT
eukprot:5834268-Amphidinium_carterae.2